MSLESDWASAKPIPQEEWDKAKPVEAQEPAETPKPTKVRARYGMEPALEAAMSLGSGAVGSAIGNVAGMGRVATGMGPDVIAGVPAVGALYPMAARLLGRKPSADTGKEPEEMKRTVQEALTFKPKTEEGKRLVEAFGTIGDWWERMSRAAGELVAPAKTSGPVQSMIGSAVQGTVEQAPQLLGAKAPEAAASVSEPLRAGAERAMSKALRPNLGEVRKGYDVKAVDTMLEQGLNVSRGGLQKMRDKVDSLNQKIADVIDNSPAVIDRNAAGAYFQDAMDRFQNQVAPLMDMREIEKVYNEFIDINPRDIPVKRAQELKRGTYEQLKTKAYGEQKSASIEAQKAIARGLKEEIAKAVPEVRPLNAEESKLLTALPMVERRVLNEANSHLTGFAWLTHTPEKFVAFMADRSPLFWSLVGRMMDTGSKAVTGKSGPAVGTAVSTTAQAADDRRRLRMERARQRQQEESNAEN